MSGRRSGSSFRDPGGFVFVRDGVVHRQVQGSVREDYDRLLGSGLYDELTGAGLLVPHEEAPLEAAAAPGAYRVLRPERIPFVSYPYEWCFGQLRDAALLTLRIQKRALSRGMSLKDASAFNVQFRGAAPVLVDTLSFERYVDGRPWVAYHQFCQHFLAPLLLMSRVDPRLGRLLAVHLDGVPLDLASRLLPRRTWLRPASLVHLHLHARTVARFGDRPAAATVSRGVTRRGLEALLEHLESAIRGLSWDPGTTEWAAYDREHGYADEAIRAKHERVAALVGEVAPTTVWDLGANTGGFSRIAAAAGARVVALDLDPGAVERHYRQLREGRDTPAGRELPDARHGRNGAGTGDPAGGPHGAVLPLVLDLSNPSPALGWAHEERLSLEQRGPADLLLALALVHHLAISHNIPFPLMADWLARLGESLIIEFVPKDDPQSQRLLRSREDIFDEYDAPRFEEAFGRRFRIARRMELPGTRRVLYLMRRRETAEVARP